MVQLQVCVFYRDRFTLSACGYCVNVVISVTPQAGVVASFCIFYRDLFALSVSGFCLNVVTSVTLCTGSVASFFKSSIETYLHCL